MFMLTRAQCMLATLGLSLYGKEPYFHMYYTTKYLTVGIIGDRVEKTQAVLLLLVQVANQYRTGPRIDTK